MAARNIPITGPRFTPRGPEWERAPEAVRKTYWRRMGDSAMGVYRRERRKGIDIQGEPLVPVKPRSRPDGATGPPLIPHYAESRTDRLLGMRYTARGAMLFWHSGATRKQPLPWSLILSYHRQGSDRLPVRNVIGLSDAGWNELEDEGRRLWRAMLRTGQVKPVPPRVREIEPPRQWRKSGPEPAPSREAAIQAAAANVRRPRYYEYEAESLTNPLTLGQRLAAAGGLQGRDLKTAFWDAEHQTRGWAYSRSAMSPRIRRQPAPPRITRPAPASSARITAPPRPAELIPPRAELPPFGVTKATVRLEVPAKRFAANAERVFGRPVSPAEVASIAGAPDHAVVQISEGYLGDEFRVFWQTPEAKATRTISATTQFLPPVLHADMFEVDKQHQGQGIGRAVFGRMVEQAERQGIRRIDTYAARDEEMNGYETWVKFGYDGPLDKFHLDPLPLSLSEAERVSDLMKTEEGREWWKIHGRSINVSFDLAEGSQSRRVWEAYLRAKAAESSPTSPPAISP